MSSSLLIRSALAAGVALLAGCAGVAPDGGFAAVADGARARTGAEAKLVRSEADERAVADTVRSLLAQALGQDAAVRIALLNHPGLQASYWEVGIAQADLAQAARLQNPGFGFKRTAGGGAVEIERTLTVSLVQALTLPLSQRLERARFEAAQLRVGVAIERHALETRRAWVEAVAARQGLDYARRVNAAAEASAALSGRMRRSGNASALDSAREQLFHAEAAAGVMRAEQQVVASRERLARLLGLWGEQLGFTLPERLPDLPAAPLDASETERLAVERRLDVQAARQEAAALAASLGLTRSTRFINVLDLGLERKSETGEPRARGYEVSLELPLFDWGDARVARAAGVYMQSLRRVAETAINARSEARERYLAYRSSWDLARHYRDEVLPLRKKISSEVLLRYNGMLASPFELLVDARDQAGAVNATIDALKDFWLQEAELQLALGGPAAPHNKEHAP
ncbi:MAG: TolC family protein [Pseudomonadota bacterium]